jgi:hypothetical protein
MKKRVTLGVALAGACACAIASVLLVKSRPTQDAPQQATGRIEAPAAPATEPVTIVDEPIEAPPPVATTAPAPAVVVKAPPAAAKVAAKKPAKANVQASAGGSRQRGSNKPPLTADQQFARQALSLVGANPEAEAVWYDAINDPSRSEHERKDLIEDLNEEGFDDPKNLTPDDLPLIVNRIAIIEQLAPFAMDEANDAAFAEAYKDLINMYRRVSAQ